MSETLCTLRTKGGGGGRYTETSLWTNSAPTSSFANQTVTISESIDNFKYIAIKSKKKTTATDYVTDIMPVEDFKRADGTNYFMAIGGVDTNSYARRITYTTSTTITFSSSCRQSASGNDNTTCIPLEILGLNELAHGKKMDETLLWSNSAPTSNFPSQTLTLSESVANFDWLEITYILATNNQVQKKVCIDLSSFTTSDSGRYAFGGTSTSNYGRVIIKVSDTSVTISDAKIFGGTTTANGTMIPTAIYGCKIL